VNGFAVVLPLFLGIVLSYAHRQRRDATAARSVASVAVPARGWAPNVDVIITYFNEQPELLKACLQSVREQDYQGRIRVWVVDDGSENRDLLLPVLLREARSSWRILLLDKNRGKRFAQAVAFREGRGAVVVFIDSDTKVAADGIRQIVRPFPDRDVGAVTSNLQAYNAKDSWLTQAINIRYQLLCERERAAQSFHGAVLCCAGPFSAFRRSVVKRVLECYVASRPRPGDDLELTGLVLEKGYRSEFQPAARAWTHVPTSLLGFARQQRRWNRSFYRELPRMLRLIWGRGSYMVHDLVARALVPPLVGAGLLITAADALMAPQRLIPDLVALTFMALASVELLPSLRRVPARSFVLPYGLIFVGLLLPIRFWAACTFRRNEWGTRSLSNTAQKLTRVRFTDLVPLLPIELDGPLQGAGRFVAATIEAQHLGKVEASLGS
jgi:N-acetylglucosaminyltransferase